MTLFQYHPEIISRFTKLSGVALLGRGMLNSPSSPELRQIYTLEQRRVLERLGNKPLSEIDSLAGWRSAFRLFGVDPTQYRSASEALLRRLTKKGDIPTINTLVDICNLVSIRYALPAAAFDLGTVSAPIQVHFATGKEIFKPLGELNADHPEPGEVIFSDREGRVVARRWCWRQSEASAVQENTQDALFTIEAQHDGGKEAVQHAISDLHSFLLQYTGGEFKRIL
jgi:DNA/RNA-binding domain of Phe-tRNA-synthetase-like protein